MALTLTSTAYSATPRLVEKGVFSINFDFTTAVGQSLSASAGGTVIFGPRIQNGVTIENITGSHSSGAGTFPVDIGIMGTGIAAGALSQFASLKASGSHAIAAKSGGFPYKVSISDDAANQFATIVFIGAPGTDTAVANFKYTIQCSKDN